MLVRAYAIIAVLGSLLAPAVARAGDNITIQGRIVNPAGNPVTGASTQFRVQILSPDAARCILYDETRIVDLSNSAGLFSLNIADGTGTRAAPLTYSLEQAISNRVDLTVDGAYCAGPGSSAGTPVAYHPLAQHNRKVVIQFRDPGTMGASWETIPEMDLNPVPYAIDSRSVGGYASSAFLKVVDGGVPGSPAAMTTAQFTELGRLISGTSENYMSGAATSTNGARLPSYTGNPSAPAAGSIWFDSGSGTVKYSTGSGPPLTIGASSSGSSAVITSVTGGDGITVTGSGALTVSLAASGVGAGDTKGSATMVPRITYDTYGRITAIVEQAIGSTLPAAGADHQVLMSNSGSWGPSYIGLADLRKDAGTPLFPGTCATNRTLNWNSVSGVFECVDLGSIASSQLAAPSGASAGTYRSVSVNAAGQVLSGTNPTTLGGYFISDGVRNGGSVPQIRSGAADPSGAGVDGELYVATTSQRIFRYNLGTTTWETMASAGGAGGTMTGINAGPGVSVTGSAATPTVGLSTAGVTAGTFAKVTTDTYGRVTGGSTQVGDADIADVAFSKLTGKPTTLLGHGITENLVTNAGGAASLQAGPTGSRPTPGTAGQIYIDTDTSTVYYRGASAWQMVASAAGSGGTLTDVLSGAGMSVTGTGATRTVSLPDVGTASTGLIKINTDAKGRVTGGATTIGNADISDLAFSKLTGTPTTVGGYGITDAVKNPDGTVPTILSGTDAGKPAAAAGNLNFIYIANDTQKIYRQISGTWQVIGAGTTAGFTGSLAGEVSGAQATTQVDQIGSFLRATILSLFTNVQNATDTKTNGAIVKRDGAGGFAAGAITADTIVLKGTTSGTATLRAPATVTTYDVQLPAAAPSAGQVLSATSGTALTWTTPLSGSTITVAAPITNSSGTIGINTASGSQTGALSSADWTTFNNKLGTALAAGSIWVGNASNVATAVAPSGDVAMTNAGAYTVNGIKGQTISAAGTSAGQVLRYAGSNTWTPNFVGIRDLRSNVTGSVALSSTCTASQTLTWDSAGDNLTCQDISIAAATQITGVVPIANGGTGAATTSQGFVFAGPASGGSGAPSFRALAASDLTGLANQWSELSANVYRSAGSVGIGTSAPSGKFQAMLNAGRFVSLVDTYPGSVAGATAIFRNDDNGSTIPFSFDNLDNTTGLTHSQDIRTRFSYTGGATAAVESNYLRFGKEQEWTSTAATRNSYTSLWTALGGTVSEKVRISSAGNLGVGTTSPAYKLSVKNGVDGLVGYFAGAEASGTQGLMIKVGQNLAGGADSTLSSITSSGVSPGNLALGSGNTEAIRINNAGSVGIGTTNPGAALDVTSSSTTAPAMYVRGNSNAYWPAASTYYADSGSGGRVFALGSRNGVGFSISDESAGAIRMTIGSTGNVGFGTAAPDSLLHASSASTAANVQAAHLFSAANASGTSFTTLRLEKGSLYGGEIAGYINQGVSAGLTFNVLDGASSAEVMRLQTGGRIGIGTTVPNHKLDINGNVGLSSGSHLNFGATDGSGGYGFRDNGGVVEYKNSGGSWAAFGSGGSSQWSTVSGGINYGSGNVGIGSNTPATKLDINGGGNHTVGRILSGGSTNYSALRLGRTSEEGTLAVAGAAGQWANDAAAGDVVLRTESSKILFNTNYGSGPSALTILGGNGNVGIGTTSPASPLHIRSVGAGVAIVESIGSAPHYVTRHAGASVTASQQNDLLGVFGSSGYSGSAYTNTAGYMTVTAAENFSGSAQGTHLTFVNTPSGSAATAAAERMRIASNGNVGIGTNNPSNLLEVRSTGGNSGLSVSGNMTAGNTVSASIMTNLGAGAYNPLTQTGDIVLAFAGTSIGTAKGFVIAPWTSANSAGLRMDGSGNVGIGVSSPGYKLEVDGTTANNSGAWSVRSDARLKKDVSQLNDALDRVLKLRGVSFRWKDEKKNKSMGLQRGFIAQEVEKVIPEWVHKGNDGFLHLEKVGIEAYLVESIKQLYQRWFDRDQEIRREVASLAKDNQALKQENELLKKQDAKKTAEIEAMKSRLDRLEKLLPAR